MDEAVSAAEGPKDQVLENLSQIWLEGTLEERRTANGIFSHGEAYYSQQVFVSSESIYHRNIGATAIHRCIYYKDIVGIICYNMREEDKIRVFRNKDLYPLEYLEADADKLEPLCFAICSSYCGFFRGQKFVYKVPRCHGVVYKLVWCCSLLRYREEDLELWVATIEKVFATFKEAKATEMSGLEVIRLKIKLIYMSDFCQIFVALLVIDSLVASFI